MKKLLIFIVALALLVTSAFAQTSADATTPTVSATTCCEIRLHEFGLASGGTSARIVVRWIRSDGSTHDERAFAVTDGDAAIVTDNWLWGNGAGSQPDGLMRAIMFQPTGETGTSLGLRFSRRVLRWLRDTGRIGATEITIPEP